MTKESVEIERRKNHVFGYGTTNYPTPDSQEVLDALIEWSRAAKNLNKKIYKHKIRREEENISKTKFHDPSKNNPGWIGCGPGSGVASMQIPYCDLVFYLDIYWQ